MRQLYGREALVLPSGREVLDALMEQLARQLRAQVPVAIPVPTTWERAAFLQERTSIMLVERDGTVLGGDGGGA